MVKAYAVGIYEKSYVSVRWTLWEYVSPMGRPSIADWRADLGATRKADLDTFLSDMARSSKWNYPDIGSLTGKQKGFKEFRWRSEGVPHRIGGYYAADNEFVMLIGFTHNSTKYDPPEALKALVDRKRRLQSKEATLREYSIILSR